MTDLTPVPEPSPALLEREAIEQLALEAAEVSESVAKVNLQFPVIGFIDPIHELEQMRRLCDQMPEGDRRSYPDIIRAKLLAHAADATLPEATDEELALAIFIKRTTDSPLTAEDLEAKATGKKPKAVKVAKEPKGQKGLDDLLKGAF